MIFGTWLLGVIFKLADGAFHWLAVIATVLGAANVARILTKKGPATE